MPTQKQMEKASRAFEYAVKQASKCREQKRIVSCYACSSYEGCEIQERVKKNLATKRGEVYIKS
jgi:hypothetical protein